MDGKPRPRPLRPPPRDAPKPRPPDAAAAAARDADETGAGVPNGGAGGKPRGRPNASDAAVAAAAATRMPPDDKRPPSPASCWRPPSLRLLLLLPEPAVAPENRRPSLPGSRQIARCPGTLLAAPMIQTTGDNGGHSPFAKETVQLYLKEASVINESPQLLLVCTPRSR